MAFSYVDYPGDGSTTNYSVTFPFISRSHVVVTVDEVAQVVDTDFVWITDGSLSFNSAPANGTAIRIQRFSNQSGPLVDFINNSILDEDQLDLANLQAIYMAQEALDAPGAAGAGETNTASNVGTGGGVVFKQKVGVDFEFRTLRSSTPALIVTTNTNDITFSVANATTGIAGLMSSSDKSKLNGIAAGAEVNPDVVGQAEAEAGSATTERIWTAQRVNQAIQALAPGGGSGEANTASNVGSGAGWFKQKTALDLEFKSAVSATTALVLTANADNVTFSIANAVASGASGLMTGADKAKLDGVEASANNYSHPNHTGDVTSTGDGATTIVNNAVTNAKLANMAQNTIKGRVTASTGDPEDLTPTQARSILNVEDGADVTDAVNVEAAGAVMESDGFAITAFVETPANKTYTLDYHAAFAYSIDEIDIATASGTITAAVQINGANVTSLSGLSVSSTNTNAVASGANSVSAGDKVTLVLTSNSSAADLALTIKGTRT